MRLGPPGDDVGGIGDDGSDAAPAANGTPLFGAVDELALDAVRSGAALTR
ncbi:MAG TPA: hypothetical protein VGJ59_04080 [Jatrophihabitantaceae bacterium]